MVVRSQILELERFLVTMFIKTLTRTSRYMYMYEYTHMCSHKLNRSEIVEKFFQVFTPETNSDSLVDFLLKF